MKYMNQRLISKLRYMPRFPQHPFQPAELFPESVSVHGNSCVELNGPFFHNILFTQLPSPPLGALDPTFRAWAESTFLAYMLQLTSQVQDPTSTFCKSILEQYLDASRDYADALFQHWGGFLPDQVKEVWRIDGPIPYLKASSLASHV